MWDKVLFVCTGNTCRSPMCASVASAKYGISADSRGLAADGSLISHNAVTALRERGFDADENRASLPLTAEDIADADLVVTVTPAHAKIIRDALPQFAEKIVPMPLPISDPFGGDLILYRAGLSDIEAALEMLFGADCSEDSRGRLSLQRYGLKIIDATPDMIDGIAALELRAFTVPWSKKTFESAFQSDKVSVFAALDGDTLAGFACLMCIAPDAELMNIAVDDAYRSQGIGSSLMDAVQERAASLGAEEIFLEVRESNAPARHLYEKYGFEVLGKRKGYYQKPVEDAILMKCTMRNE